MLRTMLIYGGIAGTIVICTMLAGFALGGNDPNSTSSSQLVGYLIMLVALCLIFIGIKRYRDNTLGGTIKFGQALLLGIGIGAVAGVAYVTIWEIHLSLTDFAFIENYTNAIIAKKTEAGLSGEALAELTSKMDKMKTNYANPLFRVPMTFLEIFPVALIISLISAILLRNEKFMPVKAVA